MAEKLSGALGCGIGRDWLGYGIIFRKRNFGVAAVNRRRRSKNKAFRGIFSCQL